MKIYRIVKEYLENSTVRYAVEYQSLSTYNWLLVNHRDSFTDAEELIKQLRGLEVAQRKVVGVYND